MRTYEDAETGAVEAVPQSPMMIEPRVPASRTTQVTEDIGKTFANDVGYADKIVERFRGSLRYTHESGKWLVFSEQGGWVFDESGIMLRHVADYARELYRWALRRAADMDHESGKRLIASMSSLASVHRIKSALELVRVDRDVVVSALELDAANHLVGAENGVVNIETGEFSPHSRDRLITRRLGTHFVAGATAPYWLKFLEEVQPDPAMRTFLQRLAGYSLHGKIAEHILPFHLGTGANGKGSFLEQALLRMAGSYAAKVSDSLVYASDRGSPPFLEIAQLCGARFALGQENAEGGRLNEKFLKDATGGDKQKGRFHYGNFIEYWPSAKIHLVGNHRPRIVGIDEGVWRRFILIEWPVLIPAEKRDATLGDKFATELPGILNWCLAGARDWLANGLQIPNQCRVATEEFRRASDTLRDFLEETVVEDASGSITKAELFSAYRTFADESGIRHPMSKRTLSVELANRGWTDSFSNRLKQKTWAGYRMKPDFE